MINYFYNIILKTDSCDLYSDVLTGIRKDFYLSKEKQKGKITQNSSGDTLFYEFSIEKEKPMKWSISNNKSIISDCKALNDGQSSVNFYDESGKCKSIVFSKYQTLLRVEYFNMLKTTEPYCVIEPRKAGNGLCLLLKSRENIQPCVLYPMPDVDDDYVLDKLDLEFDDYTVIASTNEGVVKFLSEIQLESFESFVDRATAMKLTETAPVSFIEEDDAVLAQKLNPKDFNIKRNLSEIVDISKAQEFSYDNIEEELVSGLVIEEYEMDDDTIVADNSEPGVIVETLDVQITEDVVIPQQSVFEPVVVDETVVVDEVVESAVIPEIVETEPVYACDTETVENDAQCIVEETIEIDAEENSETEVVDNTDILVEDVVEVEETVTQPCEVYETEEMSATEDVSYVAVEEPEQFSVDEPVIEDSVPTVEESMEASVSADYETAESDENFEIQDNPTPDKVVESSSSKYLYFGELDSNGCRSGFGRTSTEDGRTAYEGAYSDNKRNGVGAYYYKDSSLCYYGEWKDNKREGFGIGVSSLDKSVHVGKFADNKPVGDGVRVSNDGNIKFIKKVLSNGVCVELSFDGDKINVSKYDENGELISEDTSNLMYF